MSRFAIMLAVVLCAFFVMNGAAHANEILAKALCQNIADYQSDDAEYKPGVDVNGNAMVPADLNRIEVPIVDPVNSMVEIDFEEYFDLDLSDVPGAEIKPTIADFEIFQDGRILYNGQDITQKVVARCNEEGTDLPEANEVAAEGVPPKPAEKTPVVDKNTIDVEVLKPQDIPKAEPVMQEPPGEVIEGQYP